MTLKDELDTYVKDTFAKAWSRRDGQKVPETEDIALKNEGVNLEATILYADLASSTNLVAEQSAEFAAEIYKNYLYCAAKIIRANGGEITAYDGDRIMAVFLGDSKNSSAGETGLNLNYAVTKIIQPELNAFYGNHKYTVSQRVGIDTSEVMVARTGIRGSNDLVWVGEAANNAAKLATLSTGYASYATAKAYWRFREGVRNGGDPEQSMWTDLGSSDLGYQIYGSTWWRSFS